MMRNMNLNIKLANSHSLNVASKLKKRLNELENVISLDLISALA